MAIVACGLFGNGLFGLPEQLVQVTNLEKPIVVHGPNASLPGVANVIHPITLKRRKSLLGTLNDVSRIRNPGLFYPIFPISVEQGDQDIVYLTYGGDAN